MAKSANMCQWTLKRQGITISKTNDKRLYYLTYKELMQKLNDQRLKKQEKMLNLV